jgi:hypothetical protein
LNDAADAAGHTIGYTSYEKYVAAVKAGAVNISNGMPHDGAGDDAAGAAAGVVGADDAHAEDAANKFAAGSFGSGSTGVTAVVSSVGMYLFGEWISVKPGLICSTSIISSTYDTLNM